jgi:hypothetical protein
MLQQLLNSLQLSKLTSVVDFAKCLCILGSQCILAVCADDCNPYQQQTVFIKEVDWDIFDETAYAAMKLEYLKDSLKRKKSSLKRLWIWAKIPGTYLGSTSYTLLLDVGFY